MRIILIILVMIFITSSFAFTPQGSTSVDVGKYLPTTYPIKSSGETTKFDYTNTETQVGANGSANCPTGKIMVGIKVTYVSSAFKEIAGSKITETCRDPFTNTAFSFDTTNYNPKLLTDPTRLNYFIICRDVNMDFF